MITRLKYNIKFSTTGKSFSNEINFKPGFTVISGKNEGGKSIILEMIEYGLFGTSALRGTASTYETLDMEMDFEVRGEKHNVVRSATKVALDKNKAVGAKAVNAEIIKLLSYDMDVFRVSNFAKQGSLNDFTVKMKNTARRKMVDDLVGLNMLETVEKLCRSESNALKRLRDDLAKRLVEPVEPVKPENYVVSLELDMLLRKQIEIEVKRNQLASHIKPALPVEPERGGFDDDVEEHEKIRNATESERGILERTLRTIPAATYSRHDLDLSAALHEQRGRGPQPDYTEKELVQFLEDYDTIKRLEDSVVCPSCATRFVPDHGTVGVIPTTPPLTVAQIKDQLRRVEAWRGFVFLEGEPVVPLKEIKSGYDALAQEETRKQIQGQLDLLPHLTDRSAELIEKLAYEREVSEYQYKLERYVEALTAWSEAQEELANLPEPDSELEINLQISRTYEEQKRRYDADREAYDKTSEELESLNSKAEDYYNGAECLKFVRSQVKAALVPSLNKVASHLLDQMTNGGRKKIVVDEEFNVTVDGQPVETLSGSGISVVNLALRIALGQVLTQSVMPIFMGDELDADMDKDRAGATHEALRQVAKMLKQVIVVSHKDIQGEYNIGV